MGPALCQQHASEGAAQVVVTGPFIKNLLHNHFITEFFFKKKSGEANDEANFSFIILLHKRAKPALPPYLLPLPTYPPIPQPSPSAHLSAHTHEPRFESQKFHSIKQTELQNQLKKKGTITEGCEGRNHHQSQSARSQ
jgi:hypothetical protein